MNSFLRFLALATLALSAAACGVPATPRDDVNAAIVANGVAADHTEWELSDKHPDRMFEKWRSDKRTSAEVCPVLNARKGDELTLFEEQIRKTMNAELVANCKAALLGKIEAYWAVQVDKSAHARLDFKFPKVLERRDFREGLFIATGDLKPKQVLLTFDDGPHAKHTDLILKNLAKTNAKVIFFHMGRNVRANPEIVKHVAAAGHGIGSHSMTHACLAFTNTCAKNNGGVMPTMASSTAEIMGGHQAVFNVLGWVDPFFRFPYGASDKELKKFVADRGVGEFFWSIDSNDWRNQTPTQVVDGVMSDLKRNGDRGVILMHDIQRRTAVALPTLLQRLHDGGYSLITMRPENENERFNTKLAKKELRAPGPIFPSPIR